MPARAPKDRKPPGLRATDVAYERLTEAIVNLELAPGQLVAEHTLSDKFGISRLTLLQALHRVAETGLVSVLPRRGILIAPVDIIGVQRVFEARQLLEPRLAELAAIRASADEIADLRERLDAVGSGNGRDQGVESFQRLDEQLHLRIAEAAQNPYLTVALRRTWKANRRLWNVFFREQEAAEHHFFAHGDIISAIESKDPKLSKKLMLEHLAASKAVLEGALWGTL